MVQAVACDDFLHLRGDLRAVHGAAEHADGRARLVTQRLRWTQCARCAVKFARFFMRNCGTRSFDWALLARALAACDDPLPGAAVVPLPFRGAASLAISEGAIFLHLLLH